MTLLVNTTLEDTASMALIEDQCDLKAKGDAKRDFTDSGKIIFINIVEKYANKDRLCISRGGRIKVAGL